MIEEEESVEEQLRSMFPDYREYREYLELEKWAEEGEMTREDDDKMEEGCCSESSGENTIIDFSSEDIQAIANLHMMLHDRGREMDDLWISPDTKSAKEPYELAALLTRPMDLIPGKNL